MTPPLAAPVADAVATPYQLDPECLPNHDLIITEDDTPVDNLFSERQAKLLSEAIYSSWAGPGDGRPFVAMTNVGLFRASKQPPVVPDFLLSLDVAHPDDPWPKENRSYFVWIYGKFPDLVIEIVSNTEGGEATSKRKLYGEMRIPIYVIFDPLNQLGGGVLQVLNLVHNKYEPVLASWLPEIGLGLLLWEGSYAGLHGEWLRWCDQSGEILPTGDERAVQEQHRADDADQRAADEKQSAIRALQRADQEQQRADDEQQRADDEQRRADGEQRRAESAEQREAKLLAKLRVLGVDPDAD